MKTLLAGFFMFLICNNVHAQMVYAQGGVNFANITTTKSGNTEKNNTLTTFNFGLLARFGLSKVVDLESGALFTGKGSKAETYFNGGNDYIKTKFNPYYLEIPLNVIVNIPLQKNGLFVSAGPYIGIGVAGKSKLDSKVGVLTSSSTEDIKFSNDDPLTSEQDDAAYDKLKRFDYGVNLGAGIKLQQVMIKVGYGLGLAKINSTQSNNSDDDKNKFRTLSVSIGIPLSN